MLQARMLGNYVEQIMDSRSIDIGLLCKELNCSELKLKTFLKGRAFLSFDQLEHLANRLGVTVSELLDGDYGTYCDTVVYCIDKFDDDTNREIILDLIDDYMDIYDSVLLTCSPSGT